MMNEITEKDFPWLMLLKIFAENAEQEWEKYRDISFRHPHSKATVKYFENTFKFGIKEFILPSKSILYRARQIKNNDINKIGLTKIKKELVSLFVTEQEYNEANSHGLYISLDNLLFAKVFNGDYEQTEKCNAYFEKYSRPGFYGFAAKDSGIPPKKYRSSQRLSSKKDAYIYFAMDMNTAVYEMRPLIEQNYSIAEAVTTKELRLANLRDLFEYKEIEDFNVSCILKKISEPNTENNRRFYHITQTLSKFIKSQGFDGILYQSALNKDGSNIMLFDPSNVEFISSSVVNIIDTSVGVDIVFPFKKK